jgi:hypothetical protein
MTKALEASKKCKDKLSECVIILQELLCQDVYLPHYRGKWYDQLALLLQVHLKKCDQVCTVWNHWLSEIPTTYVHNLYGLQALRRISMLM